MRIAAIYDIHGNLPALEAVLPEIRRAEVDRIVVRGDVVPGPMPSETLRLLLDLDNVSVVVCGHTHMQFDRMVGRTRVVNAGSVGMSFGEPGAHWLLLGPEVQLRHTAYDLANAAQRIRDTGYPHAQDFAARSVLQPPSEKEISKRSAAPN
jgi:predicted phosphodiesterase